MTAAVTLNGHAVSRLSLSVPGVGLWYAGVDLADATALEGAVTLQILDTAWTGFVVSGGVAEGRGRYRVIAGAGNWGRDLPPRAYANDAALTVARLIGDVATEAGEPAPSSPPTTTRGPHFNRPRGPASFALNLLTPRAWYARPDGVVAFGARPALPASSLPVVERSPVARTATLAAASSVAGLLPGLAFEYGSAADVDIDLTDEGVRVRLYASPTGGNERAQSLLRMLDALDPGRRFRGAFEYRVVSQSGVRLNLQPVRSRADLPDLSRVPVRAGIPGAKATHALGSAVVVTFLDGDPSRPAVVGFDAPDQPGWMPTLLEFGGPVTLGVARRTDAVVAGPFGGVITGGSVRIKASV